MLTEMLRELAETQARITRGLGDEAARLRAWESILVLFFARYYTDLPDPIAAAEADRDLLTRLVSEQDEECARHLEGHYAKIIAYVKSGQELKAWRDRKRHR